MLGRSVTDLDRVQPLESCVPAILRRRDSISSAEWQDAQHRERAIAPPAVERLAPHAVVAVAAMAVTARTRPTPRPRPTPPRGAAGAAGAAAGLVAAQGLDGREPVR